MLVRSLVGIRGKTECENRTKQDMYVTTYSVAEEQRYTIAAQHARKTVTTIYTMHEGDIFLLRALCT